MILELSRRRKRSHYSPSYFNIRFFFFWLDVLTWLQRLRYKLALGIDFSARGGVHLRMNDKTVARHLRRLLERGEVEALELSRAGYVVAVACALNDREDRTGNLDKREIFPLFLPGF